MNSSTSCAPAFLTVLDVRKAPGAADVDGSTLSRQDRHRESGSDLKLRDLRPAAALFCVGMVALLVATLAPSGRDNQYAVIAPPWYRLGDTITLIQKADGGIVDTGGPANIVIAHSDRPDFVRVLYNAGAWLVIDPMRLRGCIGFAQESK